MRLDSKWAALLPVIQDICNISGIPGLSLGIVENNKTVYPPSLHNFRARVPHQKPDGCSSSLSS
ncbi:unnamed protein product [Penicillium roqueforti FM164]|uniref:Uncharacterized protein n=1 Tax=Penicillium roqueforti (strain FM164) TaxID=1365484 RepID=W6QLN3_PENRF|nr:unnamed protein product [Penicillium roqueforti FM164]